MINNRESRRIEFGSKSDIKKRIELEMSENAIVRKLPTKLSRLIIQIFSAALAGIEFRWQSFLLYVFKNATPYTASGPYLDIWLKRRNLPKKEARENISLLQFKRSNDLNDVPINRDLEIRVIGKDIIFNPINAHIFRKKDKTIQIKCRSSEKGYHTNINENEILQLSEVSEDIKSDVTYIKTEQLGIDEEDEEDKRQRILADTMTSRQKGNIHDYYKIMDESKVPFTQKKILVGQMYNGKSDPISNSQIVLFVNYKNWDKQNLKKIYPTKSEIETMQGSFKEGKVLGAVNLYVLNAYKHIRKVVVAMVFENVIPIDDEQLMEKAHLNLINQYFMDLNFGENVEGNKVHTVLRETFGENLSYNIEYEYSVLNEHNQWEKTEDGKIKENSMELAVFGGIYARKKRG